MASYEFRVLCQESVCCDHCGEAVLAADQLCIQVNDGDDGAIHVFRSHADCHDLACVIAGPAGYIFGVPRLLAARQDEVATPYNRGHFPRAVCRMERICGW